MKNEKCKIRQRILTKRRNLDKSYVENVSKKIYQRLKNISEYQKARTIMFYVSKDNEVETHKMIEDTIKIGKHVCVPYTDRLNKRIYPVMIKDLEKDLELGSFGVLEPKKKNKTDTNFIDLIITPGIAFDKDGYRLGWGKGYYDRFLGETGKVPKIGLAFEFQIVPKLPRDRHDIPVDMVITEKRLIKFNGGLL